MNDDGDNECVSTVVDHAAFSERTRMPSEADQKRTRDLLELHAALDELVDAAVATAHTEEH